MRKIIGVCVIIFVIALLGATGYVSYDIGHSDGYSSGYYSGKYACIAEYQSRINSLNQQVSEQSTEIRQIKVSLNDCKQDLSEYTRAYVTSQQNLRSSQQNVQNWKGEYYEAHSEATETRKENVELRNVIEDLQTEIEKLRVEQPTSDFGDIDDLINLAFWLLL